MPAEHLCLRVRSYAEAGQHGFAFSERSGGTTSVASGQRHRDQDAMRRFTPFLSGQGAKGMTPGGTQVPGSEIEFCCSQRGTDEAVGEPCAGCLRPVLVDDVGQALAPP